METSQTTKKFRATNIIFGLLIMLLAMMVFIFPTTTLLFLIYVTAIIIMLMGIIRLSNAFSEEKLSNFKAITRFITGLILLIFSIIVIIITLNDPAYSVSILIFLLAIALLIMGIGRFFVGLFAKKFDRWFRIVLVVIGIVTIVISIIIFFIPTVGAIYLLIIISVSLLINGLGRFLLGVVGPERAN
jgi:uncharacterized membrane protein HdeD (DUF308 family)